MILAQEKPTVSLIPTTDGYQVATAAGIIGHIIGTVRDADVEAIANLKPANGYGRELAATFKDIGQAVKFILEQGVA